MQNKVLLILCDGMRPDFAESCPHPFAQKIFSEWYCAFGAKTVFPSVTLPCHMSLMQSCTPEKHGVLSNEFVPKNGGRHGLFEQLREQKKTSAFFYSWGELKDIYEPYSLSRGEFISSVVYGGEASAEALTAEAKSLIKQSAPDFVFLYIENTDSVGHIYGWGSEEYKKAVYHAFSCIEEIVSDLPKEYSVLITADHGGHEFTHGSKADCDMTIPILLSTSFPVDKARFEHANIIDIAPAVCDMLKIPPYSEWNGSSFITK